MRAAEIVCPVCLCSIRRLYATCTVSRGGDIGGLARNIGHTTLRMATDQYLHTGFEAQRRVVDTIPDLTPGDEGEKVIPIDRDNSHNRDFIQNVISRKKGRKHPSNPLILFMELVGFEPTTS